jgi:hypothetical protein
MCVILVVVRIKGERVKVHAGSGSNRGWTIVPNAVCPKPSREGQVSPRSKRCETIRRETQSTSHMEMRRVYGSPMTRVAANGTSTNPTQEA